MKKIFKFLNNKQKEAIERETGPLLVLGGPGTGKTTTLIYKLYHLIKIKKVKPSEILILTSNNSNFNFISEQLSSLISSSINDLWIGTFFSVFSRILRNEIYRINYSGDFVIYDKEDSSDMINSCLKDLEIDPKIYPPKIFNNIILRQKYSQISSERYIADKTLHENDYFNEFAKDVYQLYQSRMKKNNALDYGDMLMLTVKILNENKTVLKKYQSKFKYIFVDDFQEVNFIQNLFLKKISKNVKQFCVFGNDDQSIMRSQGASPQNILKFEKEYRKKKIRLIQLTKNYTCSQNILDTAALLIQNNVRKKKRQKLTALKPGTFDPKVIFIENERAEARLIAQEIQRLHKKRTSYREIGILYRSAEQAYIIENQLRNYKIPFETIQPESIFKDKHVKDLLAYIKVCFNRFDEINLLRIINLPNRGIGFNTIDKLLGLSRKKRIPLWEVISENLDKKLFSSRIIKNIKSFIELINNISQNIDLKPSQIITLLIKVLDYFEFLKKSVSKYSKEKIEIINKLISIAKQMEDSGKLTSIPEFVQMVSLYENVDFFEKSRNKVTLMEMKSSKGFNFDTVIISGMEDGVIPHYTSFEVPQELEEERRLLYIGITSSKNNLYLINVKERNIYNKRNLFPPSRFINEIQTDKTEIINILKSRAKKVIPAEIEVEDSKDYFKIGRKIVHPIWGKGIIKEISGYTPNLKLTIQFARAGTKKISLVFLKNFLKKTRKK